MKDSGELKYFLGIEIARSKKGILMNQRKFVLELITELGLSGSRPVSTPMEYNLKLTYVKYDEYVDVKDKKHGDKVHVLSQFMQKPKESHLDVAIKVVKYVKNEPGLGILLSSKSVSHLIAYCDADWAACPNTRRSITSYAM
ncbi:uncharacterized mitochondrial protein AtMg00810-like [Lycium ferocissimum]|uniref:uncharacterized mitochondrial protein AtMg00810-like n=1 Tax=Lycium ferocissimum TaxID=112874 RepID=UPI0028151541|nr:uncharacterized mitochondrial protein AtMg00810-like [Lycium ferocissimum]